MERPVKEPMNESMDLRAIWIAYIQQTQLIWPEPFDDATKYEVYKDGELFMDITEDMFLHPTMFDHDHHTNLFWKTSNHENLVLDYTNQKFTKHYYYVKAFKYEDDILVKKAESKVMEVNIT